MQIPNISLAYQIAELAPIVEGSIVRKVQELENNWLKIRLQTRQGGKDLIAAPDAIFLTGYSLPARQQTSGFGAFLRKQLANKRIASFEQHGIDRIAVMGFEGFFLIFELFAKGNVILADREMCILSAFRKEEWKDRALKKGERYKFPSSRGISPLELDESKLGRLFRESSQDVVRALVREVNIAPVFAEAACAEAGIEKEKPAGSLNEAGAKQLLDSVKSLCAVDLKKEQPLLARKGDAELLLPFPLKLPAISVLQRFSSINEALDNAYSRQASEHKTAPEKEAVEKKRAELQESMRRQRDAVQALQRRIEENSRKAELIYANYTGLFELVQAIKLSEGQKMPEKEIMYKLRKAFPILHSLDLKRKKLVVSFPD